MEHLLEEKISSLAIDDFAFILAAQEFNVDFYCKGNATLKEALRAANVNEKNFLSYYNKNKDYEKRDFGVKVGEWPLDLLSDYIQRIHHRFTDQTLVELKKAVNEYLDREAVLKQQIEKFKIELELLAKELGGHMKKEELILFPFIRKMTAARDKIDKPGFKSVENPIEMMIHEHDTAYGLLRNIRKLFNNYQLEESEDNWYVNIVQLMGDLDQDLTLHLHLENNILFPKAVALEKNKVNL